MKEIREAVKKMIIAQGGKLYGYNITMLRNKYGWTGTQIQNATDYFRFSPQQKAFREKYNYG